MEKDFEKVYHDVEKDHFWFKSRRKYIAQLLKPLSKSSTLLDIGCSSGILLLDLEKEGFDLKKMFGIDISREGIKNCHNNGIKNAVVMDAQQIEIGKKFDILVASDCLEHLKDDKKALDNWYDLLNTNGVLLVFVPAFMSLWSNHDVVNMHYRRYTRSELVSKLTFAGFEIEKASYWNFFLFIPIYVVRSITRFFSTTSSKKSGNLDKSPIVNDLLYFLIVIENKLLTFLNFPFGVSTFCIARKV